MEQKNNTAGIKRLVRRYTAGIALSAILILTATCITGAGRTASISVKPGVNDAYPPGYYEDDPLPDKTAYLTFDDGPSDWTAGILDILKKENIRATFFICGDWAPHSSRVNNYFKKYRDVLIRMIKEGHAVGNHTAHHSNLAYLTPEKTARQFDANQELLNKELGPDTITMTLIRPPAGFPWYYPVSTEIREKVGRIIRSRGVVIMWSRHFDSRDSHEWVQGEWYEKGPRIYMGKKAFKDKMHRIYVRLIDRAVGKGMVILFHDTHPTTMDILPAIIGRLKKEGYHFGTMEDYVKWRFGKSSADIINGK